MKPLRHLALLLLLPLALTARAEPSGLPTLEKISRTATISLGHRESSVPFSYYDSKRQVVGYSHDLMLAAVERIRRELKLPALAVKLVPVTSQNRIPLVQNGSVDLECGSTTHNRERARQVAFSVSIFVTSSRLLTRHGSGIEELADLKGRRVAVTAGTTSERSLLLHAEATGTRFDILKVKDHGDGFNSVQEGRAGTVTREELLRRAYALGGMVDQYLIALLFSSDGTLAAISRDRSAVVDTLSLIWERGMEP